MEHLIHNIGYFSEIKTAIPVIMKNCILKNKTSEKLYVTQKEKEGETHLQVRNTYGISLPFSYLYRSIKTTDKTTEVLLFLIQVNEIIKRKYYFYSFLPLQMVNSLYLLPCLSLQSHKVLCTEAEVEVKV